MQPYLEQLGDEIAALASHLSAAVARWLALVAEFDSLDGWVAGGFRDCAHWLSWRCGISEKTARDHLRVAHRLQDWPQIEAAFARGELSYSKVRALTRCGEGTDEEELLRVARAASAGQLERIVRAYRSVTAVERAAEEQYLERSFAWRQDEDGAYVFHGRLPAEQGALVARCLEACRDELGAPPKEIADGASAEAARAAASVAARNADALIALAQTRLAEKAASADVYQLVVHVDVAALAGSEGGRCELSDCTQLPAAAARRLACDASIVRIIERDGKPLSVGRKTRTISPAMKRALYARDHGCAFPGCGRRHHTDGHHIIPWSLGGETELDNLVLLCGAHHTLQHAGRFCVEMTDAGPVFARPDGTPIPQAPRQPRGDCKALSAANARRGVRASAQALYPVDSDGERFDLGWTIEGIVEATARRRE